MNYGYLFITDYEGSPCNNCFEQLKTSIQSIKDVVVNYKSINIFTNTITEELRAYSQAEGVHIVQIPIVRNYSGVPIASVLVHKIFVLRDFDETEEIVLLDLDTKFTSKPAWDVNTAMIWAVEYPLLSARNLHTVLPYIPWETIGVKFTEQFTMKNTGVVFIPKADRKELCEKAIWVVDYLNSGQYPPEDRSCNKLDEQIAFSILLEDKYSRDGRLRSTESHVYHYWAENMQEIRWWEQ